MHIGFDFVVRNLPKGTHWLRFRAIELGFARPWSTHNTDTFIRAQKTVSYTHLRAHET